jgi:hypothetical protein
MESDTQCGNKPSFVVQNDITLVWGNVDVYGAWRDANVKDEGWTTAPIALDTPPHIADAPRHARCVNGPSVDKEELAITPAASRPWRIEATSTRHEANDSQGAVLTSPKIEADLLERSGERVSKER